MSLEGVRIWVTAEEIRFAYERGYEIYLEEAEVCKETADIYKEYINDLFNKRRIYKLLKGGY